MSGQTLISSPANIIGISLVLQAIEWEAKAFQIVYLIIIIGISLVLQAIEEEGLPDSVSAMEICAKLISNVARRTAKKRQLLEKADLENKDASVKDRREREKQIVKVMKETPGKLDHAAVVAVEVGEFYPEEPLKLVSKGFLGEKLSSLRQQLSSSTPPSSPEYITSNSFDDEGFQEIKNLLAC